MPTATSPDTKRRPTPDRPRVSIVVPAFHSHGTLARCLAALRAQTFTDHEVLVVDSTPADHADADAASAIVAGVGHDSVRLVRSARRLLPHDARNLGMREARGALVAFTDPDIYPAREWLATLVEGQRTHGGVVFGPLACVGRRWLDVGAHLCKFAICLPEPGVRALSFGWSGSMLGAAETLRRVGGFPANSWQGDTLISARLRAAGLPLTFVPEAVAWHDHEVITVGPYLRERYVRGAELARLRAAGELDGTPWTGRQRLRRTVTSLAWPMKVVVACGVVVRAAWRAGLTSELIRVAPVVVAGQTASVLGATSQHLTDGWRRRRRAGAPRRPAMQ